MKKYQIIFAASLLFSAFTAIKLPQEGTWPNTWPFFIIGVVSAILALYFWYRSIKIQNTIEQENGSSVDAQSILTTLTRELKKIRLGFEENDSGSLCIEIEAIAESHIAELVNQRMAIIRELGMKKGADIVIKAAQGERQLNRVWSALKDGHRQEAKNGKTI